MKKINDVCNLGVALARLSEAVVRLRAINMAYAGGGCAPAAGAL